MKHETTYWLTMLAAVAMLVIGHHADYLLQAFQHGWPSWLDLSARAAKWGAFDFVPHDLWHIVQMTRNLLWLVAPILWMEGIRQFDLELYWTEPINLTTTRRRFCFVTIATLLLVNAVTRGIGFSLAYRLYH